MRFRLKDVPSWLPVEERFCRACPAPAKPAVLVVEAVSHRRYTFPVCASPFCKSKVEAKIMEAIASATTVEAIASAKVAA